MEYRHLIDVKELNDGSGDAYIELPPELLNKLSWEEGDDLDFDPQKDGSILIKKVSEDEEG
jgi:antitoxin component of MazEF toxin-antitoxin module